VFIFSQGLFLGDTVSTWQRLLDAILSTEGEYVALPERGIVRQGKGTFTEGKVFYQGTWKEDRMEGEGTITFADGCSYTVSGAVAILPSPPPHCHAT